MTYQEAEALLNEHIDSVNLKKHVYAVEAALRFYAKKIGEDEEKWALAGLLHDLDYEKYPEKHPEVAVALLTEKGVDIAIPQAIAYHAKENPETFPTLLDKALWGCDEITGFITAVTLVKPSKKIADVTVDSVKKKMKDKAFARPVSRDDLRKGAEVLGVSLEEHIGNVLGAMQAISDKLGL